MKNTTFFKLFSLVIFSIVFVSCDKDYNTIGSDIVGNENFNFTHETFGVKTYNQKIPAIQTNNLPINQLGIYNDNVGAVSGDVLGRTTANFVTQLSLATPNPTFTDHSHVVVDSVVLTVPYFSTSKSVDSNGHNTYRLDSIYSTNSLHTRDNQHFDPIDLKVYRNGFSLQSFNPNDLQTAQKYFSDQDVNFDSQKLDAHLNNDSRTDENTAFVPSNKEIKYYKVTDMVATLPADYSEDKIVSRLSPRMRLHLNTNYFRDNVLLTSATNLFNNNNFITYFNGLYFKVENASTGSLMSLDFSKGDVTIYYKQDILNDTSTPHKQEMKTFVLKMKGTTVNLLNNTDNPTYLAEASNPINAKKLYLKGGQGSMAYIELFSNPGELAALKARNVLVNDASLTFTVNSDNMTNKYNHPQRIYVYDADNNRLLFDYFKDKTEVASNSKLNKYIYGGIKQVSSTGVITYKIRITELVNKILKESPNTTKENIRLGVVVTEDINLSYNASCRENSPPAETLKFPAASVMNPLGTILYGTDLNNVPPGKEVKFEIYYTKPN